MRELRPGLWHWQAPHPDWDGEGRWLELVSSYAVELGDDLVLFDPLSVPDELRGRATAVALTAPYHERDVTRDEVVERLRPLLELPVEIVLPAHGEPTGRDALERALA